MLNHVINNETLGQIFVRLTPQTSIEEMRNAVDAYGLLDKDSRRSLIRFLNCLERNGIKKLAYLKLYSLEDLLNFNQVGPDTITAIQTIMKAVDINFISDKNSPSLGAFDRYLNRNFFEIGTFSIIRLRILIIDFMISHNLTSVLDAFKIIRESPKVFLDFIAGEEGFKTLSNMFKHLPQTSLWNPIRREFEENPAGKMEWALNTILEVMEPFVKKFQES